MFCDLRDFSTLVDGAADLSNVYLRVNAALNLVADEIEITEGTVVDFQGDSVFGFWDHERCIRSGTIAACRAAVQIREQFQSAATACSGSLLNGLFPAFGISAGSALVGPMSVGSAQKQGAFGPIVNLGSRLQGLTKRVGASILIDGTVARTLNRSGSSVDLQTRWCGRFLLAGLSAPVDVHELLSPRDTLRSTPQHRLMFQTAVSHLLAGRWSQSRQLFAELPADDPVRDYFVTYMSHRKQSVPDTWNGVIPITGK